jgi:phosphoribosylanthranilate isomerase
VSVTRVHVCVCARTTEIQVETSGRWKTKAIQMHRPDSHRRYRCIAQTVTGVTVWARVSATHHIDGLGLQGHHVDSLLLRPQVLFRV